MKVGDVVLITEENSEYTHLKRVDKLIAVVRHVDDLESSHGVSYVFPDDAGVSPLKIQAERRGQWYASADCEVIDSYQPDITYVPRQLIARYLDN